MNNCTEYNQKLKQRIKNTILNDKLSHAYIIEGIGSREKMQFVKDFIKAAVCLEGSGTPCNSCLMCKKVENNNLEDMTYIESDGLSVKDEAISRVQEAIRRKPVLDRNFVVISDADTITIRGQNRLLKTLEEPQSAATLFLLCENRENLLETVKSRCVLYRLPGETSIDEGFLELSDKIIDMIIHGEKFFPLKSLLEKNIKTREEALLFLDAMELIYENILLSRDDRRKFIKTEGCKTAISLIEEAKQDILMKVKYEYALKNLMIKVGGNII